MLKGSPTGCILAYMLYKKGSSNMDVVLLYLKRKSRYRKLKDRKKNVQVNYLWIAKATKLSYKQVRRAVDNLCITGAIVRYHTFDENHKHINWYKICTDISTENSAVLSESVDNS